MSCASAARAWSRPRLASKRAGASKRRRAPAPRAAATRDAGPARVAVFVSGGGSNMRALHAAMLDGRVDAEVAVVVSNAPDCGGVTWARENGVPTLVYPPSKAERERNEFAWQTFYVLFRLQLPAPLRVVSPLSTSVASSDGDFASFAADANPGSTPCARTTPRASPDP